MDIETSSLYQKLFLQETVTTQQVALRLPAPLLYGRRLRSRGDGISHARVRSQAAAST